MLIPFDELFQRHKIKAKGALHLGANTGQEAEAYCKQGISQVIWVEALPHLIAPLRQHVSRYMGSIVLEACVSDRDGEKVTFYEANNGGQSSSLLQLGTHAQEHPSVEYIGQVSLTTTRVDTLLRKHDLKIGYDWFLNVDLQGAELLALKGMGDLLSQFKHAYIEVNERELYKGCPLVADVDSHMGQYGFIGKETKMTAHGWGDKFYQRA